MKKLWFLCSSAVLVASPLCASGPVTITMTPATKERCHIVKFPRWTGYGRGLNRSFSDTHSLQFRVFGVLGTRFLVADKDDSTYSRQSEFSPEKYLIDAAYPQSSVTRATQAEWDSATPITLSQATTKQQGTSTPDWERSPDGKRFAKSGAEWVGAPYTSLRTSPDHAWIALQSYTGTAPDYQDDPLGLKFWRHFHGSVFIDIYNMDTEKKSLLLEGRYSDNPDSMLLSTGWVTERYFIVPLGWSNERCLICDFGGPAGSRPTLKARTP
jgi:hypothetical protein